MGEPFCAGICLSLEKHSEANYSWPIKQQVCQQTSLTGFTGKIGCNMLSQRYDGTETDSTHMLFKEP